MTSFISVFRRSSNLLNTCAMYQQTLLRSIGKSRMTSNQMLTFFSGHAHCSKFKGSDAIRRFTLYKTGTILTSETHII